MALDSSDRKIMTYLNDEEQSMIFENCFTTNRYQNIKILKSIDDALHQNANSIIINLDSVSPKHLKTIFNNSYTFLIFLNSSKDLILTMNMSSFETVFTNGTITILKPISKI